MAMTRSEKQALAFELMAKAGDIVEFWEEHASTNSELSNVDPNEAAQVLAQWLSKLPGTAWDGRLPDPK